MGMLVCTGRWLLDGRINVGYENERRMEERSSTHHLTRSRSEERLILQQWWWCQCDVDLKEKREGSLSCRSGTLWRKSWRLRWRKRRMENDNTIVEVPSLHAWDSDRLKICASRVHLSWNTLTFTMYIYYITFPPKIDFLQNVKERVPLPFKIFVVVSPHHYKRTKITPLAYACSMANNKANACNVAELLTLILSCFLTLCAYPFEIVYIICTRLFQSKVPMQ